MSRMFMQVSCQNMIANYYIVTSYVLILSLFSGNNQFALLATRRSSNGAGKAVLHRGGYPQLAL
jgi:hypothetical protein